MIVFKGKYIEKKDDFYLEEVENLTIGKSYKVLKEDKEGKEFNKGLNGCYRCWTVRCYVIVDDNGSVCTVSAKHFWTLEEWRDIKLNNLGI
jgi:hypothetical protein